MTATTATDSTATAPRVSVCITGIEDMPYAIFSRVHKALIDAGQTVEAAWMTKETMGARNYAEMTAVPGRYADLF